MDRVAVLGASRGLGLEVFNIAKQKLGAEQVQGFARTMGANGHIADLSKVEAQDFVIQRLKAFSPTKIFYCAGGGPFGKYENKQWKDHLWTFQVNFLFPARVLHWVLAESPVKQFVCVGSAIAESSPDPNAASYAASKHALRGLISSVIAESPEKDVRLFSPGYMDTPLLPPNAWPRHSGRPLALAAEVAQRLWQWASVDADPALKIYREEA